MTRIAIFASGRGSNFDAIADAIQAGRLAAEITSVVCDRPGAPVIEKARARGIKVHVVPPTDVSVPGGDIELRRDRHEELILDRLGAENPEWLVFAGYMRILGSPLLARYRAPRGQNYHRIVNVHPSLLPAFPGKDSYAQAFQRGCAVAGVTVHLVEKEVDGGPIAAQEAFSIAGCASADEVEALGLELEHRIYPETLGWLLSGNFEVIARPGPGRRFCVRSR